MMELGTWDVPGGFRSEHRLPTGREGGGKTVVREPFCMKLLSCFRFQVSVSARFPWKRLVDRSYLECSRSTGVEFP